MDVQFGEGGVALQDHGCRKGVVLKAPAPFPVVEMWPEMLQTCSCGGGDGQNIPCEEEEEYCKCVSSVSMSGSNQGSVSVNKLGAGSTTRLSARLVGCKQSCSAMILFGSV